MSAIILQVLKVAIFVFPQRLTRLILYSDPLRMVASNDS